MIASVSATPTRAAVTSVRFDVFISHASEDKDEFVRPLASALTSLGLKVWYDEWTLTIGDSLRQKIDEGLLASDYGIVVLSRNFFIKKWPQAEFDGLFAREMAGRKVILPVWHDVKTVEDDQFPVDPSLGGRWRVSQTGSRSCIEIHHIDAEFLAPPLHTPIAMVEGRRPRLAPRRQPGALPVADILRAPAEPGPCRRLCKL